MSNPSLPPRPEPSWPLPALADIAAAAAVLLEASRVWVALRDRHGSLTARIAYASDLLGEVTAIDPRDMPSIIARAIAPLANRNAIAAPVASADLHATPELRRLLGPDAAVIRAFAAVPLLNDGQIVGALIVTSAQPGHFSDRRRLMLNTFANQAVAAIQMTASVERNAAQALVLGALLSASQALTSTLDSDEVFHAIIESIQQVITCDSALIYHYDERAANLRVITGMGQGTEQLKGDTIAINNRGSRAAWVARHQHAFMGAVGPADRMGAHTDTLSAGSAVALLCMPLISKGRLRGVASLARQIGFTAREVSAMERLSPIAAAALENVEFYHKEQAARRQQEALFASASEGFAVIDDELRFMQVNPAFARYVAADPAELLGQPCCDALGAATESGPNPASCLLCRNAPDCLLRQVMQAGIGREHVECLFPPPATQSASQVSQVSYASYASYASHASMGPQIVGHTIDFSLTPMQGPDGRPHLLLVGRDVSGPREMERFRAEQIHMVSHEMGAPLQTISGHIDHFVKRYGWNFSQEQRKLLDTARASAIGMKTLVDDLDLLSRRDAGELQMNPEPTDLGVEAHKASIEMDLVAQDQGVTLLTYAEPNLPPALVDPVRARQVARNLIINAIKFTPSGGRVRVSIHADADWVTMQVEDTGIGIPEHLRKLIWDRYYRVPQPEGAERIPGRGLGLAIVRIIVTAHHGERDVQSTLGKGTVFTVRFPHAGHGSRQ